MATVAGRRLPRDFQVVSHLKGFQVKVVYSINDKKIKSQQTDVAPAAEVGGVDPAPHVAPPKKRKTRGIKTRCRYLAPTTMSLAKSVEPRQGSRTAPPRRRKPQLRSRKDVQQQVKAKTTPAKPVETDHRNTAAAAAVIAALNARAPKENKDTSISSSKPFSGSGAYFNPQLQFGSTAGGGDDSFEFEAAHDPLALLDQHEAEWQDSRMFQIPANFDFAAASDGEGEEWST
ncbi:unnamed protein product [Chrysoparadoxa australica]